MNDAVYLTNPASAWCDTTSLTDGGTTTIDKNLQFVLSWKNPQSGAKPDFDGVNAQFTLSAGPNKTNPAMVVKWKPPNKPLVVYDLKPASAN